MTYRYITKLEKLCISGKQEADIIPIEDDYSKKLDIDNLVPLTDMNHKYIHELYKKDKVRTQERLRFILNEWNKQFAS